MSETAIKTETQDNDGVVKTEKESKEKDGKQRSVSFNRDVHVKRFGKPRERGTSDQLPTIRKEPFTHLSEEELIEEANKVIAQAQSVTCTADHPPEKFFSLPHRRKLKEDRSSRRNSDVGEIPEEGGKSPQEKSNNDVNPKRKRERTSLSTLFRRAQRTKSPDAPVVVTTKPVVVVKRSKSDVSDLKSNTTINKTKPIRKRSGSETEEFLKSLRNKKSQLSPIIESSPREDYFKKTSPLDLVQSSKNSDKLNRSDTPLSVEIKKVNPVEKPPRHKSDNIDLKPPTRSKRGKSSEKEQSPTITETPKRKTDISKTSLVDEIDSIQPSNDISGDIKDKIKDTIRKIEENVYADKEMKHSSQQPPEKPPLTRGHTVGHIVRILREDQHSSPTKSHLITPSNGSNSNKPFSYTKPSTSPDPNLFIRNTSPDRAPTPVNKMTDRGVIYAQVIRDNGELRPHFPKQIMHRTFSPSREKFASFSDEDEGLGYEERHKYSQERIPHFDYKNDVSNYKDNFNIKESPIKPRFREYKLTSFEDAEPTYANGYADKAPDIQISIEGFRGRADGMDTMKKAYEPGTKIDLDFNELSYRRELLESRLNARRFDRDREKICLNEPISKYLAENDPIYEAEKRMKQTEKYVNDTVKYYRHTLERDGIESTLTEDYKYDPDNHKIKYNTESRIYRKPIKDDLDRRDLIDDLRPGHFNGEIKVFPPEPEYEPPSLESNPGKLITSPDEYKEKKYRVKKQFTSSHDLLQGGQKYKGRDDYFGKRKGHYASNPEIAQEREDEYANLGYHNKHESYHNSLRRVKSRERDLKGHSSVRRHDSGDSRDYYREQMSPRRLDFDNRLVDSGIENDFRHNSSSELHRSKPKRHESDEDVRNTSLLLASERQHTEDNYPSEQIYANGEYLANRKKYQSRKDYIPRDRSVDDGSILEPTTHRHETSPSRHDEKISAKPPKAAKKLSGLEKMKQLFSRDSSKKSKKEKEVQPKTRTRVLKSPEHLARDDPEYKRYTDPEPSDIEVKKRDDKEEKRYRRSRENLDSYRSLEPRDSVDRKEDRYGDADYDERFEKSVKEDRKYKERREERRRYNSSERESDRPSDAENDRRRTRSRTAGPLDSPALAQRYRERRRLATPSPTPSPPRRESSHTSGSWFKSMDRLGKKREKTSKVEKDSVLTTEDEASRRVWSKQSKPLNSPAKNLRFFGDTDQESESKHTIRSKSKNHGALRKTISNSSAGLDEVDHRDLANKSYSLSNLQKQERKSESPKTKDYYKRNLKNISKVSNSENESQLSKRMTLKPPISPYDRSRSHSSSKTLKGSKNDMRRNGREDRDRGSSELRSSKPELRELKPRRHTPVTNSGESSTEGDSSQQSQRSVVYLHATTVGDIPDPGRTRNRSRDDVSSVMSSNVQVKTSTKSFSLFAPWTPKHYNEYDVHYEQKPRKPKEDDRFKKSISKNEQKKSSSTLSRRSNQNRLSSSNTTLYRHRERKENDNVSKRESKSRSSEVLNGDDRDRVSRSISIPKDKKAGWFKMSSKKKQESSRVR